MKIIKKLNFIFWAIFCFSFLPLLASANDCLDNGGVCTNAASCSSVLGGGIYDTACSTGEVCCENSAASYSEGSPGFMFLQGHIVPCGRETNDPGTPENETRECTMCHLFLMLKRVFDLVLSLLIIAAILFITIGGVVYIVSTGNPSLTGLAKNIIKKTLIGFALMMAGWLMVYTLLVFLSAGNSGMVGTGGTWYEFTCDEVSNFD